MSFLKKMFGISSPTEVMRAEIYMEYHPLVGEGAAAVEWVPLTSNDVNLRPCLLALLYARTLVNHAEARKELFNAVDAVSKQNVRDEGRSGFVFPDWSLSIGSGIPPQKIWPWELWDKPAALTDPKVYRATLQAFPEPSNLGRFGINLDMAWGQERILAPACALIAIVTHGLSTDREGRYELAVLLWQINEFYGSPHKAGIGSESKALAAAMFAIRNGDLRSP